MPARARGVRRLMECKKGILNARLAGILAGFGHVELLVVADAGLPVPAGVELLDLALVAGVPSFPVALGAVLDRLVVEAAVVASELEPRNPAVFAVTTHLLGGIPTRRVSHAELREMTLRARLAVRTGECTPYANVVAGVPF